MTTPIVALSLLATLAAPPPAPPATASPPPPPPAAAPTASRVLGLDEAISLARQNQPQLRQARAGTEAAQARADEARSALLPQLTGTAGYARATVNLPGIPESGSSVNQWTFKATLNQLVWDFGQTTGRWESARESAISQQSTEQATQLQVLFNVRSAFFTARAGRDLVGVARETLQNQETHLRQVQGFVEVGRSPEIDLAQVRTDRANAEVQLIQAQNAYETAKASLNQVMGVEGPTDYEVADDTLPPVEGEDSPIDVLLAEALPRRPDVAALEAQVRAQRATLASVSGGYWPSLGLAAGASDVGTELSGPGMTWNWSAGATLTWYLFQGGLTSAQVREARANLVGLDAQLTAIQQQVRLDLEQARLPVRAAKAALSAAGEALFNARERLRLAEGRYQTGAGSIIELGDAQVALTSAAAQKVQADYALSAARALLLRALGRPAPGSEASAR